MSAAPPDELAETRRRFLRAIAERIPPERVEEVRLFRPIRQGGRETGVAVVAVTVVDDSGEDGVAPRHTVYTAHYRLTLKGAARGKWETDVTAEADAPLAAVDDVVRGVQRRAGDEEEAERLPGDAFREALSGPLAR